MSNGRNAPTQEFIRTATYGGNSHGAFPNGGVVPPPGDADFNGDGNTDVLDTNSNTVDLVNLTNYRSW